MIKSDFERMHNAIVDALHAIAHFGLSIVIQCCKAVVSVCKYAKKELKRSRQDAKSKRRTVKRNNENETATIPIG
jgi:hypothetical protein